MVHILFVQTGDAESMQSIESKHATCIETLSSYEALERLHQNQFHSERVLIVSDRANISNESLNEFLDTALQSSYDIASAYSAHNGEHHRVEELSAESIIHSLRTDVQWPLHLLLFRPEFLHEIGSETRSLEQAILRIIIRAVSEHAAIDFETTTLPETLPAEILTPTRAECGAALHFAVNTINIEELFPHQSWDLHQEESAAACYHHLAARFITFHDYATAHECLAYGDRLEDSPRSLALKGFIALQQGETLTAVANMVSSLQEYEKRKQAAAGRYLIFQPRDLEQINVSLESGLQELNKRNNDAAASHFLEAVLNFDSFYEELGLASLALAQQAQEPVVS